MRRAGRLQIDVTRGDFRVVDVALDDTAKVDSRDRTAGGDRDDSDGDVHAADGRRCGGGFLGVKRQIARDDDG